jgi:hypothetical protein
MNAYDKFLESKRIVAPPTGFEPGAISKKLFHFQHDCVQWACRRGRAALFEDCGLGKTPQQLIWADQVCSQADKPVLILAPLCVTQQTAREGSKFGVKVNVVREQAEVQSGINITNYEKLHHFDPLAFGGVVLDESSILKAYDGATRNAVIGSFRETPYRLACTATPAPNDFMELGNHAEFLGVMSRVEMLATFFVHDGGDTSKWRLKGHAEKDFWRWLCSWAVNIRKPSDLGYADGNFKLPKLNLREHVVQSTQKMDGYLFAMPASSLAERRDARRQSIDERAILCYELINANEGASPSLQSKISQGTREGEADCCNGLVSPKQEVKEVSGSPQKLHDEILSRSSVTVEQTNSRTKKKDSGNKAREIPNRCESQGAGESGCKSVESPLSGTKKTAEVDGEIQSVSTVCGGSVEKPIGEVCDLRIRQNGQPENVSGSGPLSQNNEGAGLPVPPLQLCDRAHEGQPKYRSGGLSVSSEKWLVWCQLNSEQDLLEKLFGKLCVSIRGTTPDEDRIVMEREWREGPIPVLISKPSIFGFGMNWQHCHNVVFLGISDSYEDFYQSIRRVWRFGQTEEVNAHIIISSLEGAVLANIKRKETDARRLADEMIKNMSDISAKNIRGSVRETEEYKPTVRMQLPEFLSV